MGQNRTAFFKTLEHLTLTNISTISVSIRYGLKKQKFSKGVFAFFLSAAFCFPTLLNAGKTEPVLEPIKRAERIPRFIASEESINQIMTARELIFGGVLMPVGKTHLLDRWDEASQNNLTDEGPWSTLVAQNEDKTDFQKLTEVNRWVNERVKYIEDQTNDGTVDLWSNSDVTLSRKSGDCEDYAIAKMHILEKLGIDPSKMYLVIMDDKVARNKHAVLVVKVENQFWALDNFVKDPYLADSGRGIFYPNLAFNKVTGAYTFGFIREHQ